MKKFLKKLLASALSAAMIAGTAMTASAASAAAFRDVKPGAWYCEAVEYVAENGLFQGTTATTFSPNDAMTRGMFVTVLGRKHGVDTVNYTGSRFADVKPGAYYAPYVEWAAENGIVSGTDKNHFSPNDKITVEQMAAILYRYAHKTGSDDFFINGEVFDYLTRDSSGRHVEIAAYAADAMDWALTHGVLRGDPVPQGQDWSSWKGILYPRKNATRAQVAQVLLNSRELLSNTEFVPEKPKLIAGIETLSNGKPMTEENVQELLYSLREIYPEGMRQEGCTTFAYEIVWGYLGYDYQDPYQNSTDTPRGERADFNALRSGDIVSYRNSNAPLGHNVVVLEKHGDSITVVEGNYGRTVHWDREITREELENSNWFYLDSIYPVYSSVE